MTCSSVSLYHDLIIVHNSIQTMSYSQYCTMREVVSDYPLNDGISLQDQYSSFEISQQSKYYSTRISVASSSIRIRLSLSNSQTESFYLLLLVCIYNVRQHKPSVASSGHMNHYYLCACHSSVACSLSVSVVYQYNYRVRCVNPADDLYCQSSLKLN